MPKTKRPQDPRQKNQSMDISFAEQPVVSAYVQAIMNGGKHPECNEIFGFGTRGDGKTIGVMCGMIAHAQEHQRQGFSLPVPWMGVTDTFTSHKLKTVRSFENPIWRGGWKLSDGDHIAIFFQGTTPMVKVDLFGIEDQGAMDRLRMESCGMWFEEPAPSAVMVQSTGIGEHAWELGLTSLRVPSHFHPAVTSENYPDEDHWTWRRPRPTSTPVFAHPAQFKQLFEIAEIPWPREFDKYPEGSPVDLCMAKNGTCQWFRVPAGERASEEDRLSWTRALAGRKDLLRRLILGQPGVIMLGDQVAQGFSLDDHVAKERLLPWPGQPIYFGFDFGHTPTCVMAQEQRGQIRVLAGLHLMGAGIMQLMDDLVLPFLSRYAPWVRRNPQDLALIGYDPSQGSMENPKGSEADIENSALQAIQRVLDGWFESGPIDWAIRKDALVKVLDRHPKNFQLDPEYCQDLASALAGRWYYAKSHAGDLRSDKPKKPNHPYEDLGDALIYCLCRISGASMIDSVGSGKIVCNIGPGM
jgi:hypothetical protein